MSQIERLKLRIPEEPDENILNEYLESAKAAILSRRYPFDEIGELEARYFDLQIRLAVQMYNKQGAEGETSHSENGISRAYEEYDTLLKEVIPKVKVL